MTRQVVNCILEMKEYNRFTKGIYCWVGFNTKWIGYPNAQRAAGETKFSMRSLIRYWIERNHVVLDQSAGVCVRLRRRLLCNFDSAGAVLRDQGADRRRSCRRFSNAGVPDTADRRHSAAVHRNLQAATSPKPVWKRSAARNISSRRRTKMPEKQADSDH